MGKARKGGTRRLTKTQPSAADYEFAERLKDLRLVDEAPTERYYIRAAVDNMRRMGQRQVANPDACAETSYQLACFTKAIKELYADRDHRFQNVTDLKTFLWRIVDIIHGGNRLTPKYDEVPRADVDKVLKSFTIELYDRLNRVEAYDPIETIALIEYRLRYANHFYPDADRRIASALGSYALMRDGLKLPEFVDFPKLKEAAMHLPPTGNPWDALDQAGKPIRILRKDSRFRDWVKAFHAQFRRSRKALASATAIPTNAWTIKDSSALDHESTTYQEEYITRSKDGIDRLREATGKRPELLVVFTPERMALHETIAAAVTRIKMEFPTSFIQHRILGRNNIFEQHILPRAEVLMPRFREDKKLFDEYVKEVMDDHFHIVNPNMDIREVLDRAKGDIIKRIQAEDNPYNPRLVESGEVLHHLVADELLRRHYLAKVRRIVDEEFDKYLGQNPGEALPLKPASERMAWVTVGGPASGKSALERVIVREYKDFVSRDNPLCQVNSDHYKPLLLAKSDNDPEHGNRTYWESGQVRQRIIDRLGEMVQQGYAPDFWVSTMVPTKERMELLGKGGAKVNVYVVSCPVETANGAVVRAHARALDKKGDDYLRFMSTESILDNHKKASLELPGALAERRRDLRFFSTAARPNVLVASMDSHNREMRVFDPDALIDFVRKSFININAESPEQVYVHVDERQVAVALCKYLDARVSFNFRYSPKVPNVVLE